MLADDALGQTRETTTGADDVAYRAAFDAIDRDPNHALLLAETDGAIAGMLQWTLVPGLTYCGGWRGMIEGVRVDANLRGHGVGHALIAEAIERFREAGCRLVQLTTDKRRPDAIRFYEDLGFTPSHEGMKLHLPVVEAAAEGG
ncbi:MAG: GNAT family N-acetyltransferase [Phycisphaerales bacterium]